MVDRIPAFQPGGLSSIPGGVRDFIIYPGTGCMPLVCVLSYTVSFGGPDILVIRDSERPDLVYLSSVLVHGIALIYRHLTHGYLGCKSPGRGVCPILW